MINDIDGDPRPQGCSVDIGADEVIGPVFTMPPTGGSGSGPNYSVTIPTGAFTETVVMTLTTLTIDALPTASPPLQGLANQFDVTVAYAGNNQAAQLVPGQVFTLTTSYSDANLNGVTENTIALFYWDGSQWRKEHTSALDMAANTVVATPNHFSIWALFGAKPISLFLPFVVR